MVGCSNWSGPVRVWSADLDMDAIAHTLTPTPLLHFEIVFDESDLFIALNGHWKPSDFESYSVDANGCFILRAADIEAATLPMPEELRELMGTVEEAWFVKIDNGQVLDQKVLPRTEYLIH